MWQPGRGHAARSSRRLGRLLRPRRPIFDVALGLRAVAEMMALAAMVDLEASSRRARRLPAPASNEEVPAIRPRRSVFGE